MITLSNLTSGTQFCGSPITIATGVRSNTFPTSSTMRMAELRVYHNSISVNNKYAFIRWETDNGRKETQDISTIVRSICDDYEFNPNDDTWATPSVFSYQVIVGFSYLLDGEVHDTFANESNLLNSNNGRLKDANGVDNTFYAIDGRLSDYERLALSRLSDPIIAHNTNLVLSHKPDNEIVVKGQKRITSTLYNNTITMQIEDLSFGGSHVRYIDANGTYQKVEGVGPGLDNFRVFCFINSLGVPETIAALILDKHVATISKISYNRETAVSSIPDSRGNRIAITESAEYTFSMSSGAVEKDWQQWWAGEFLQSKRHWILVPTNSSLLAFCSQLSALWIPCTVTPTAKEVTLYDRSAAKPLSVDFTVTLSYDGPTGFNLFAKSTASSSTYDYSAIGTFDE